MDLHPQLQDTKSCIDWDHPLPREYWPTIPLLDLHSQPQDMKILEAIYSHVLHPPQQDMNIWPMDLHPQLQDTKSCFMHTLDWDRPCMERPTMLSQDLRQR